MLFPAKRVTMVAMARKGPNGIASLRFFILSRSRTPLTIAPTITPISKATNTKGNPVVKPINAAILTSPNPIPPRETKAVMKRKRKPMHPPIRPFMAIGQGNEKGPVLGRKILIIKDTSNAG